MKSKINDIIREEVKLFLEDFQFNNDDKSFTPNDSMVANCKKAIDAVSTNDLTQSGGNEGSGKQKAQSIINKEPISHSVLKRMKAFFDNNYNAYQAELGKGANINNSGIIQSWNLWGGDAGKDFSNQNIDRVNSRNLKRKEIRRDISPTKTSTLMDPFNTRIKK